MRTAINFKSIVTLLCSLGAHLGHLRVEAYQSLSYYVLGGRSLFVVIDLDKTVPMLKSAIIFFEHMILHYGHAVFCHSSIASFSPLFVNYVSRVVNYRNQSFSYWRWVPGCITNYRYVFLRLVDLLFSEVRYCTLDDNIRLVKSYHSSFFSYYNKLWLWFLNEYNISIRNVDSFTLSNIKNKFNLFFVRSKQFLLHTYLDALYKRNLIAYEFINNASGVESSIRLSDIVSDVVNLLNEKNNLEHEHRYSRRIFKNSLRTMPSFISFLFRICYVIKHKAYKIQIEYKNKKINEDFLFTFLFSRLLVFWRAIIFFKCFRKTAHLPDCLVMLNPDNSSSEFYDFISVKLPVICVADTTTDISSITYPIPSNDDSIVLFLFYLHVFLESANVSYNMRFLYL